jgi:CheY-like chemotaxis protein
MIPFILIVEDDENSARVLSNYLELNGFIVKIAQDGQQGLNILSKSPFLPDVIISDIEMPVMDGYKFYMEVSKDRKWSKIPFFFLSGVFIDSDDVQFGKLLGVDDYFIKPIDNLKLLEDIKGKLEHNVDSWENSDLLLSKLNKLWKDRNLDALQSEKVHFLYLYHTTWSAKNGPVIKNNYPKTEIHSLNLKNITTELCSMLTDIYKSKPDYKTSKLIFRFTMEQVDIYVLIDTGGESKEPTEESEKETHMISVIAPYFHYLQAERFKEVLSGIGSSIRGEENLEFKEYWNLLLDVYQQSLENEI